MTSPPYPDAHLLNAAHGWLMLGSPDEAEAELVRLQPPSRSHPRFYFLLCRVLVARKLWNRALAAAIQHLRLAPHEPEGWIHRAYCLHEMSRTPEALSSLKTAARLFPKNPLISFNLACYCCHLKRFDEALFWVDRSLAVSDG